MSSINYGPRYNKALTLTEIAALIRKDIAAAVKAGQLPAGLKTSVRKSGSSIDVRVIAVPAGFQILSDDTLRGIPNAPRYWQTEQAQKVIETLEAIHWAYNFDGSDIQTDYFHVNYYGNPSFHWELTDAERKAYEAAQAAPAAPAPAPAPEAPQAAFLAWAGAL